LLSLLNEREGIPHVEKANQLINNKLDTKIALIYEPKKIFGSYISYQKEIYLSKEETR